YFMIFQNPSISLDWYRPMWKKDREDIEQIHPFSSYIENPFVIAYEMTNSLKSHGITECYKGSIPLTLNGKSCFGRVCPCVPISGNRGAHGIPPTFRKDIISNRIYSIWKPTPMHCCLIMTRSMKTSISEYP